MSLASLVAEAAAELESLLTETCIVTAINADGTDGDAVTVACAVVRPAGDGGPFGGGGNQISRPGDETIMLPRTTTVATGYRITRSDTGQSYSVSVVPKLRSHDPLLFVSCVEVGG